jgi:hypothetical protein
MGSPFMMDAPAGRPTMRRENKKVAGQAYVVGKQEGMGMTRDVGGTRSVPDEAL